jgi:hypothetical protein
MQLLRMRPRQKPIFSSLDEIAVVLSEKPPRPKSPKSRDIPAAPAEGPGSQANHEAEAAAENPLAATASRPTIISSDGCPECLDGKVCRLHRKYWMRLLPNSELYRCEACQTRFLSLGRWILLLPSKAE